MASIPSAVLSDRFKEVIGARRLISAVFLTFKFDPAFFEQEVVPVLLDVPLSHAPVIRLVQLEDMLRDAPGEIAVYYDANGLDVSDEGSAKLDIRRIPVRLRTGIFHAKNAFLLVEGERPSGGEPARSLIVASLSANLTRPGWWENVESAHLEELEAGSKNRLKDDLVQFLSEVRRRAGAVAGEHGAIDAMLAFLRQETEQRAQRSSGERLHTHFYNGRESLDEFIERVAGNRVRGANLEIVSPYFDDASFSDPLERLQERFAPSELRVFLPRTDDGTALCNAELYRWVTERRRAGWGRLSGDLMRRGRAEDAGKRFVHAKVYRFFRRSPAMEICFVGSANLTRAAHQHGGNLESGFLVEVQPSGRPDFWLEADDRKPKTFEAGLENEGVATTAGSRLAIRFRWDEKVASAFWNEGSASPDLALETRGLVLGYVSGLAPQAWVDLSQQLAEKLRGMLMESSLVRVVGDRPEPVYLLVQEDGMAHKPSLLLGLSVADILRYWSMLTPEQRMAFIEQKMPDLAATATGQNLIAPLQARAQVDTLFDRFAGIYHAFGCLERSVRDALERGASKEAAYRLFGQKYDSLPTLLERLTGEQAEGDQVERYVIALSARQMHDELKREFPEFWQDQKDFAKVLRDQFQCLDRMRIELLESDPVEMPKFLDWFDNWFMKRAKPLKPTDA